MSSLKIRINTAKLFPLLLFIFLFPFQTFPQSDAKVFKILSISVEGNVSADQNTIIANSGLRVGDEIRVPGDETINAIRQLWTLNIFSDVQIIVDKAIDNGVFLKIKVAEYPRLEKFVVQGNDHLSSSEIEEKITLIRGQIVKPQDIKRLISRLKAKYEEDGYLNTSVRYDYYRYFRADTSGRFLQIVYQNEKNLADEYMDELDLNDLGVSGQSYVDKVKNRVLVKLTIDESNRVTVRNVFFKGNSTIPSDDLKGSMEEISEKVWWKFWSSARFDQKKLDADKKKIAEFYRKAGYRDAEVLGDSLHYYDDKSSVDIYISVYEGPQYKIRNINWEGNTVYNADVLNERLGFYKGNVYDFVTFNQNLRGNEKQSDIASLYLDNGYLTFNMDVKEKRVAEDSVDIYIKVIENNQFKVGKVTVNGNDKTKDKVIRRELYTVPGDFFNKAAMIRSLQQLANLQYFNVEKLYQEGVDYNLDNDSTVNIAFKVEEKSSDYLNASIGYSGSFGFSGAIGVTLTNFSILEPFSLGGGQVLNFNWQFGVGNLYRTFSLGFTEPWFMDTPTLVGFDFFSTRQRYIYDLSQTGGTLKVGRRLKWPDDYFYLQGTFRYQNNDVIDGGGFYREGQSEQFTLGATISRRDVDNPIFPSRGSSLTLSAELSGGPFLPGDVDFLKLSFNTEWYKRIFNSNKFALYLSSDIGYIDELVKGTAIQPFELFYMGGSGLVIATVPLRGYDDRTVGPRQANGDIIGGRVSLKYTAELRFAVALDPIPLYVLAFAEAGNVFEGIQTADFFSLRRSAGFGARILINPIGLIGFDLGYGFDRKDVDGTDPKWQFHFQFGRGL